MAAEGINTSQASSPVNPRNPRRFGLALTFLAISMLSCGIGAALGYTQGPALATLVASGSSVADVLGQFRPCFTNLRESAAFRGAASLFGRQATTEPGAPTPTPPPRTVNPNLFKAINGTITVVDIRQISLLTAAGTMETISFFPFNRVVTKGGHDLSYDSLRIGDTVDVFAVRQEESAPFSVICVVIDVDPK
jgi:hypothetical protein